MVNKKSLLFILTFVLIVVGLIFILAALDAPTGLIFGENTTSGYDKEGNFTVNWTAVTNADNYTIFIYSGGTMYTSPKNNSVTGYSFSNTTEANYTFTIQSENATAGQEANSTNISMIVDTTAPAIDYLSGMYVNTSNVSYNWIYANVSVTELYNDTIVFNLYYSNGTSLNSTQYTTAIRNINWTGLSSGTYIFNVTANDSATNENSTSSRTITLDTIAPTATASCTSSTIHAGDSITCTCGHSDAISGVNSYTADSTPDTSSLSGTQTYTCTVTDYAGNSASSTATYTIVSSGGGASSSSSTSSVTKAHSWVNIVPGTPAIMKDFDEEIGIKQIKVEVNNNTQNVKLIVKKYETKPAEISVEKSAKIYRYFHIQGENLEGKLEKATIRMQIEKSWVLENNFEINNILMFKFNEDSGEWIGLDTNYVEDDEDYYYYDALTDAFSYFVISEKSLVEDEGGFGQDIFGTSDESRELTWLWILIILAILIGVGLKIKKKKR